MTETVVLIGTRRGLFIARADPGHVRWTLSEPLLPGREIYHASFDARSNSLWVTSSHRVWGAHLHRSTDGGRSWQTIETAPHHSDHRGLTAIWQVAPGLASGELWAGIEPAGLFVSRDDARSWSPVEALHAHATAAAWQPAGGALALHSIHVGPGARVLCAVSAGGAYRSDDAGTSWRPINRGVRADFLPGDAQVAGHCVHRMIAHAVRADRLYQQNHCGVYRSDDGGDTWHEISAGLPSSFGYAVATDPRDPDTLLVVPEESSHMRTAVGGRLRVYRTRDAGQTWHALTHGLPQEHAWVSVLRDGLACDGLDPAGYYLGTSGGHLFASRDDGERWEMVAGFLPRILCVAAGGGF